jgi:hypothetical protein
MKKIGEEWGALDAKKKEKYEKLAATDKQRYEVEKGKTSDKAGTKRAKPESDKKPQAKGAAAIKKQKVENGKAKGKKKDESEEEQEEEEEAEENGEEDEEEEADESE